MTKKKTFRRLQTRTSSSTYSEEDRQAGRQMVRGDSQKELGAGTQASKGDIHIDRKEKKNWLKE
jgi:hypothetical protein